MPGDAAQGKRILVPPVGGEAGRRIQAWRQKHDPAQARRLPPHATLCYSVARLHLDLLGVQVRHAFPRRVAVRLGRVREMHNAEGTFYVEVLQTAGLDEARRRLFDRTHVCLPRGGPSRWHVTCVRYSHGRDLSALRMAAAELAMDEPWVIATVSCLELRGDRYVNEVEWVVGP